MGRCRTLPYSDGEKRCHHPLGFDSKVLSLMANDHWWFGTWLLFSHNIGNMIYIYTYISNIYWWYHILYYPIYCYVPSYMGWDNPKPIDEVHHFSRWLFRNHVSLGGPLSRSSKACAASSLENGFFPFSSAKVLNPLFQKYTRRLLQADFSGPRRHPKDFPEFLMFLMKKVS